MPYNLKILKNGGVIAEVFGTFTPAEHSRMQHEMYGTPPDKMKNLTFVIADYTKMTKTTHSSEDLKKLAGFNRTVFKFLPGLHLAVVVPQDSNFGRARIWRAWLGEKEDNSMIFRTRAEAEDWIREISGRSDMKFE